MLIKKLTDAYGFPGYEGEIRNVLKEEIKDHVDNMRVDRIGNLIAVKNENKKGIHIAITAHMDEVGFCVKGINAAGLIKFVSWGVDARVVVSKVVKIGKNKIPGVIGAKPIHMQKPEERTRSLSYDDMYIDIGAKNKEDAEKLVSPGDYIAFDSEYVEFGDHKIKAKALDDRVGCAVLIELLKKDFACKITASFNAQEEVGTRGAAISANQIFADYIINVEGTICNDVAEQQQEWVTTLGAGPAVYLMDGTAIYPKKHVDKLLDVAEKSGIPHQIRRATLGGTDAGRYMQAHGGSICVGLAVPTRYIHSPVSVIDRRDYENTVKLITKYIETLTEEFV